MDAVIGIDPPDAPQLGMRPIVDDGCCNMVADDDTRVYDAPPVRQWNNVHNCTQTHKPVSLPCTAATRTLTQTTSCTLPTAVCACTAISYPQAVHTDNIATEPRPRPTDWLTELGLQADCIGQLPGTSSVTRPLSAYSQCCPGFALNVGRTMKRAIAAW